MKPGVVVGYDCRESSEPALDAAADEAARRGADLTVVHAFRHGHGHGPVAERTADPVALGVAQEAADLAGYRHPGLAVHPQAEAGPAPAVLADLSADADLLVVGHRGRGGHGGRGGLAGLHLGSVALRAVTRAACPTIVVRGAGRGARGVVLAAVDVGTSAEEILDFAFTEAGQRGARLKAISALEILWPWTPPGDTGSLDQASIRAREHAAAALESMVRPWRAKYPDVPVECEVVEGAPTEVLTAATTYADLIVAGARRRGHGHGHGHPGLHIGPAAHALLLHADCPVAVVPHA